MENDQILVDCSDEIRVFVIRSTIYLISVPATYVTEQLHFVLTILVLSREVSCMKTRALNVGRLLDILAVSFSVDCKFWTPSGSVTGCVVFGTL